MAFNDGARAGGVDVGALPIWHRTDVAIESSEPFGLLMSERSARCGQRAAHVSRHNAAISFYRTVLWPLDIKRAA